MTYKDIINRIRETVEEHTMIQDFGYGQLSDLKTQSQLGPEEQGVDYPYMFLLPSNSTRAGSVMQYSFNMIMMDMARLEEGDAYDNYISIQSDCQQYIDDILARLYYYYSDQPEIELTGITYTPFKEKYQDELAGMTATITIQVPTPLNECIAPFASTVVEVEASADLQLDPDPGIDSAFTFETIILDKEEGSWNINRYESVEPGEYIFTLTQPITLLEPTGSEVLPVNPVLRQIGTGVNQEIQPVAQRGWPTAFESEDTVYNYTATFKAVVPEAAEFMWELIQLPDVFGTPESGLIQKQGGKLKIARV